MKKTKLSSSLACAFLAISLLFTGCGDNDNSSEQASTDSSDTTTTQGTTEATTQATSPSTEATANNNVDTTGTPSSSDSVEAWEVAMTSGTLNAFQNYFDIDVKPYKANIEQAGETNEISYYSEVVGADRQAYVYTPYNYDKEKKYPVVYLIHGIGCDGGQWVSMGAARIFDNMIANGEIVPFIAVFPSVIPPEGIDPNTLSNTNIKAFTDFVSEFETDLAPYIKENYSISDKREDTAVCGLSMGGMEALCIGFTKLDTFNYIGSFSAAPSLDTRLLTTEGSDYIPELVLVCSGDSDYTVQDNPLNYHKKLQENGVEHIWYQHPGGGHSPNVWDLGLVNFLKRTFTSAS